MKRVLSAIALSALFLCPVNVLAETTTPQVSVKQEQKAALNGEYLYVGYGPLGQIGVLVLRPGEIPGVQVKGGNVLDLDRAVVARILGLRLDGLSDAEASARIKDSSELLGLSNTPTGSLNLPLIVDGTTMYVPLTRVPTTQEVLRPSLAFGSGGGSLNLTYQQARANSSYSIGGGVGIGRDSAIGGGIDGSYQWGGDRSADRISGGGGVGAAGAYLGLDYLHAEFNVLGEWDHTYGFGVGLRNAAPTARFRYAKGDVSVDAGLGSLYGLPVTGVLIRSKGISPVVVPNISTEVWTLASGRAPLTAGVLLVPGAFVPAPFFIPELLPAEIAMTPVEYQSLRAKQIGDSSLAFKESQNKGLGQRVQGYVARYIQSGGSVEFPEASMGLHVLPTAEYSSGRFNELVKNFEKTIGVSARGLDRQGAQEAVVKWFIEKNGAFWQNLSSNEQADVKSFVSSYVNPVTVPSYAEVRKRSEATSYRDRYAEAFEVKVRVTERIKEEYGATFIELKTRIALGLPVSKEPVTSDRAGMVEMQGEELSRVVRVELSSDKRIAKEQAAILRSQAEQERALFVRSIYDRLVPSYNRKEELISPVKAIQAELLSLGFNR